MSFGVNRRKISDTVIALAMALLIGPFQAGAAELINIQFEDSGSSFSGAAVDPSLGGTWNQLTNGSGTSSSLVNSSGVHTSTSISWTGGGVFSSGNGFSGTSVSNLMTSYLYASDSNSITFSNLKQNTTYSLYIYSQGASDGAGRKLSVGGSQINGGSQTTQAADPSASTFIAGQNYLTITGNTDASGTLSFDYGANGTSGGAILNGASEADINGIQLMEASGAVPEPSTYVLMGIGGLMVAFKLRSRSLSLIGIKTGDKD